MISPRWLATIGLALGASACTGARAPDLVITNARVFTNDTTRPWAEALAIKGERVVAVGERAAIGAMAAPSTRVVDVGGRVLVPGFNDARVDLALAPPTPAALTELDRWAISRGVTSLQVVAGGPMRSLVAAAQQAQRQARWRLIRSPMDGERPQDDEPFLPPQPGERLRAAGVAWSVSEGASARHSLPSEELDAVVGWAYGAEDPLVLADNPQRVRGPEALRAIARVGVPDVWRRKRPRVDLFQLLNVDEVDDAASLGVVATWLPTTDEPRHLLRAGASAGALVDGGVVLCLGSAGPPLPMRVISAAIASPALADGRLAEGRPLTRDEAVRAATWGSAFAEKTERDKGWLGPGTLADIAVLSEDVFTVPAERLPAITSVLTLVGGAIVYDPGVLPR